MIECHQKVGPSFLGARAKRVIRRIRRDLRVCARDGRLRFLAQQVDEQPDGFTPDFQPPQDGLALGENLL